MTGRPLVILLNGPGSAGKTSLAKALQTIAARPMLHVQMDDFLAMLPEAYMDHAAGLRFEVLREDGRPSVRVHSGPVAERALAGMRRAVAALAGAGNDLIVDEVMLGDELADYRRLLAGVELRVVGVRARLEVLEAREALRGDRAIGLSRWQHQRVHAGRTYDLEIDTSERDPLACAGEIKARFGL